MRRGAGSRRTGDRGTIIRRNQVKPPAAQHFPTAATNRVSNSWDKPPPPRRDRGCRHMLYSDTADGFSIDFDGSLDFTNLAFSTMTLDFTMGFDGSTYIYTGVIIVDGETMNIEQFMTVLE